MRWEQLDEPVKVRADFQGGVISPVVFRRGTNRIGVRTVNTRWQDTRGKSRICYFSVTGDTGDVYQLCFDTAALSWRVEYVLFDG